MAARQRRSLITFIATSATRRWQISLGFMVMLLIAGVSAYGFGLDREGFPPVDTPIAIVTGTYFVDDADTVDAEVTGIKIGPFALLTFAGELPVTMGLHLKRESPHEFTFIAGVTNGYLYYTPTAEQLKNRGGAQEDSDCFVAPEWQRLFEDKALEILSQI